MNKAKYESHANLIGGHLGYSKTAQKLTSLQCPFICHIQSITAAGAGASRLLVAAWERRLGLWGSVSRGGMLYSTFAAETVTSRPAVMWRKCRRIGRCPTRNFCLSSLLLTSTKERWRGSCSSHQATSSSSQCTIRKLSTSGRALSNWTRITRKFVDTGRIPLITSTIGEHPHLINGNRYSTVK